MQVQAEQHWHYAILWQNTQTSLDEITSRLELKIELNRSCRVVTGCLKPINVDDLYLLAGIALANIRRCVMSTELVSLYTLDMST